MAAKELKACVIVVARQFDFWAHILLQWPPHSVAFGQYLAILRCKMSLSRVWSNCFGKCTGLLIPLLYPWYHTTITIEEQGSLTTVANRKD